MSKQRRIALAIPAAVLLIAWLGGCEPQAPTSDGQVGKATGDGQEKLGEVEQGACNPIPPVITFTNPVAECISGTANVRINPTVRAECDLTPQVTFSNGLNNRDPDDYPFGTRRVRITALDDQANLSTTVQANVNVQDTLAPVLNAGGDVTQECQSPDGTVVTLNVPSVTDACVASNQVTVTNNAPSDRKFLRGIYPITFTAVDPSGNTSTDAYNLIVRDTTPPSIDAGNLLVVQQSNGNDGRQCAFNGVANSGTIVELPLPVVSDLCTDTRNIVARNDGQGFQGRPAREICAPNGRQTTITWTATDSVGLQRTDTVNVNVTNSGLGVNATTANNNQWGTQNVSVNLVATGGSAPFAWNLVGTSGPTTAPGTTATTTATFAQEGLYCPLYVWVNDSANRQGASSSLCFGIERTAPSLSFTQIPSRSIDPANPANLIDTNPNNQNTWPVYFAGERVRAEMEVSDLRGNYRSGLKSVRLTVDPGQQNQRVLLDQTFTATNGSRPGTGPDSAFINGCNTNDAACVTVAVINNEPVRQIDVSALGSGPHIIETTVTDFAGNTTTQRNYIRVRNFGEALVDLKNYSLTLRNTSPLSARAPLQEAADLFQSASNLFTISPGYAFLLSRRAWQRLDEARAQGASVDRLREMVPQAINSEVLRIIGVLEAQNFTDWTPLDDPGSEDEPYLARPLLTGRLNSFTVDVQETLLLSRNYQQEATQQIRGGRLYDAISSSVKAFDTLSLLYDDQVYATLYNRPVLTGVGGARARLYRGSLPTEYGLPIANSLIVQIDAVISEPGVPNEARNTLTQVRQLMVEFREGVAGVNQQGVSNEYLVRNIYLKAIAALEKMGTLQESSIYTYYWQAQIVFILGFVVDFSLYTGPTSLFRAFEGVVDEDVYGQVAECRFDRAMQAQVDGRLDRGVVTARNQYLNSKCLIIKLFNDYYTQDDIFSRTNRYINPADFGCNAPVVVDVAAECPCNNGNIQPRDTVCDGIDNDCDGNVDEDFAGEACGFGGCAQQSRCSNGQVVPCIPLEPLASVDRSCHVADDDCDGVVDDDWQATVCGQFGCRATSTCVAGREGVCVPRTPENERCDGRDNNCDGGIDEGIDNDQDGYGPLGTEFCRNAGRDCNDNNPLINPGAAELCDGLDNNCNNIIDEGVKNACDDCDARCTQANFGVSTNGNQRVPFSVANGENVAPDQQGRMGLSSTEIESKFAWYVSSSSDTIYKVDTSTGRQVGRYAVGSNPSRTALDSEGNVYVANRGSGNTTKIGNFTDVCANPGPNGENLRYCECRDRNNNRIIETSKDNNNNGLIDGAEYLGANDECLLWTTPGSQEGYYPRSLAIDGNGNPWVGNYSSPAFVNQLRPSDGAVLRSVNLHTQTYGAVIDANGILWITSISGCYMQSIQTSTGTLGPLRQPPGGGDCYGIAIDGQRRIIQGTWDYSAMLRRYAPGSESDYWNRTTGTWRVIPGATYGNRVLTRGVTVDSSAQVWMTHWSSPVGARLISALSWPNNDNGTLLKTISPGADCDGNLGIGVGFGNNLWVACYYSQKALQFSNDININTTNFYPIGADPYTYSDFTGSIRDTFTSPRGSYTQVFESCPDGKTLVNWDKLRWDGVTPPNTAITMEVRTGNSQAEVRNTTGPAEITSTSKTINLTTLQRRPWVSVKVILTSQENGVIPYVSFLDATRYCQ
jgi:streptogramin lyase